LASRDLPKDYRVLSLEEVKADRERRRKLSEEIDRIDKHSFVCGELVSQYEQDYLLTNQPNRREAPYTRLLQGATMLSSKASPPGS